MQFIEPEALQQKIKKGEAITVLDIRTAHQAQHFPVVTDSRRAIPCQSIKSNIELVEPYQNQDALAVICQSGSPNGVGAACAKFLEAQGFPMVFVVNGGGHRCFVYSIRF